MLSKYSRDLMNLLENGQQATPDELVQVAARIKRGTPKIRVVDVTVFWATDWESL